MEFLMYNNQQRVTPFGMGYRSEAEQLSKQ